MSDFKLKDNTLDGVAIAGDPALLNKINAQVSVHMKQLKRDYEYSIINGTMQNGSDADTAFQIGGIYSGIVTNKINASGAALSKTLIENELIVALVAHADYENPVFLCSAKKLSEINAIYGLQVRSNTIGGINLQEVLLPTIGMVRLVHSDLVPTTVLLCVDLSMVKGVSCTTAGQAQIAVVEKTHSGQGILLDLTADIGIDYTHESKHGAIYGLAE